jgi:hypothetical protein
MGEIDEAELVGAAKSGAVVDAAMNGLKRVVQAALLRKCCRELKDQIDPRGLRLPGLLGNGLRLRRDLDLSHSRVAGAHWTSAGTSKRSAIWLCEAEIGGRLLCAGTTTARVAAQSGRTGSMWLVPSGSFTSSNPSEKSGCSAPA